MTTVGVDTYRISKQTIEFHVSFLDPFDKWGEYCSLTSIRSFVEIISDKKCSFNILNYCTDVFRNHSLAKDLCSKINNWIVNEVPKAKALPISQLKEILKLAKKPRGRSRSHSLLNVLSKRGSGSSKSYPTIMPVEADREELESFGASLEAGFSSDNISKSITEVSHHLRYSPRVSYDDESDESDEEEEETKEEPFFFEEEQEEILEPELASFCLKSIQSANSKEQIAESVLKKVLVFTKASQLCFLRSSPNGNLLLDGSLTRFRTWSLMQGLDISNSKIILKSILEDAKQSQEPIYIKNNDELKQKYGEEECYFQSIMCIPIIIRSRIAGCLYINHHHTQNAFEHVKFDSICLIIGNLIQIMNNLALKHRIVKIQNSKKSRKFVHNIPDIKLQDTLRMYKPLEGVWDPILAILTKRTLLCFSSAYDTHAKNIICLSNIVKFQCATPKQFRKSGTGINIPPNNCGKKAYNKQSWLYIKTSDDEEYWIWFEHYEIAKNWTDKITLAKDKLEPEKIAIPENIRIAQSDITKEGPIGKGGAASVFKGTWNETPVAIKEFYDQFDKSEQKSFFDEMTIHASLHHPNIIRLFGGFVSPDEKPCMVLEYASKGSLNSILYDSKIDISSSMKLQFIKQTAQALSYLHGFEPSIIHRDLKPANILISADWSVKLADFGLARKVASTMTSGQGTVKWMAPEVLSNAPYTDKSDIYSLALIIWEVLMQEPFFEELKFNSQIEIQVVNHNYRPPLPSGISEKTRELITECWSPHPVERPSALEIVKRLKDFSPEDFELKHKNCIERKENEKTKILRIKL